MRIKVSCAAAKKVSSQIQKKIRGALKDMKNDQPRSASSKLYQAGNLILETTKGILKKNASVSLRNEAIQVSMQLCKASTMYWPKWQDRTEAMLAKFERIVNKSLCK
jgi:hypothetical protein